MIVKSENKDNYTILSNAVLLDDTISDKARGVLVRLLCRPENWNLNIKHLVKTGKDGNTAVRSAVKELEKAGYIQRDVTRHENGRIIGIEYIICENKGSAHLDETCPTEMGGQVHEELTSMPDTPCHVDDTQDEIIEVEVEPAPSIKNNQMSETVMKQTAITETAPIINTDIKQELRVTTTTTPEPEPTPAPEPVICDQAMTLSSSYSTNEIINLIPEQHQTPVVISLVNKAVVDYPVREVEEALAYAGANVRGGSMQFKAYLDKTLKNKWAEGFLDTMQEPSFNNFNRGYGAAWIHPMAKYPNGTVTGDPRMDTNYLVAADFLMDMGVDVDNMCAEA